MLPDEKMFSLYEKLLAAALSGLAARGEPLEHVGELAVMNADAVVEALARKAAGRQKHAPADCPNRPEMCPDCDLPPAG